MTPDSAFKPTVGEVYRSNQTLLTGSGSIGVNPQENVMSRNKNLHTAVITGLFCIVGSPLVPAIADDTTPVTASSENPSPEVIVDAQLAAYNRRDLEGFLGFYAEDAVLANHPNEVTQTGKDEMRTRYRKRFSNPVHAEILKRTVFGRFVIDHERVVAAPPAEGTTEAVAIYEIKDGKIVRVTFLKH